MSGSPAAGTGTLTVTTDPSPLAVMVSDHELKVVVQGASPLKAMLPPGLYAVRATRAGRPDLTTLARVVEKSDRPVHLSVSEPSTARVVTGLRAVIGKYWSGTGPVPDPPSSSIPSEPVLDAKRFWIRFFQLESWETANRLDPLSFSTAYIQGRAVVDVTNTRSSVVFAQLATPSSQPLNVALPPAGARPVRSQIVVSATSERVTAYVRLGSDWANSTLQYMARGYIDQARDVMKASLARAEDKPSLLGRMWRHIVNRFDDPSAMLVPRYLGLRTGEDTILSSLGDTLLDVLQPGIADGFVISAEILARRRHYGQSADRLMQIKPGNLPLFTEGFSLLVHRIRELLDSDAMVEAHDLPNPAMVTKLKELRRSLSRWAPYLDLTRPTVTFRGSDVAAPTTSAETVTPAEADGWVAGPEPPVAAR